MPARAHARLVTLPNFYFRCTTAYAILRHEGVPLGKKDFIGKLPKGRRKWDAGAAVVRFPAPSVAGP